jgi:hypothetical protein
MTTKILTACLAIGAGLALSTSTMAQGRVAGAAVGAAAGAHSKHAVAGAVVGSAVGHHMAKTHEKKQAAKAAKKA